MRTFLIPAAMIAALALPAATFAQTAPNAAPPQGQNAGPVHHHGGFMHAMKNLNLSAAQKTRIDALMSAYHQSHPKGSAHDPQAMKALHDQVLGILTPSQQTQLKANLASMHQETAETNGANGQDNDTRAPGAGNPGEHMMQRFAALNLSDQQKTQIQNLVSQFHQAHPQGSPRDPQAMKTLHDQINALLTPQQQQQLQAMHGNHDNGNGQPPNR